MRIKIGVMLCSYLLTGAVSGCRAEESSLKKA